MDEKANIRGETKDLPPTLFRLRGAHRCKTVFEEISEDIKSFHHLGFADFPLRLVTEFHQPIGSFNIRQQHAHHHLHLELARVALCSAVGIDLLIPKVRN